MITCLQCAVLAVLGGISAVGRVTNFTLDMLASAKVQLKKLLVSFSIISPAYFYYNSFFVF